MSEFPNSSRGSRNTKRSEWRDGGWCELNGAAIADGFPQNLDPRVRVVAGPRSVTDAWNGAAFDSNRMILYFHGGGHRDYGGNEVYSYDLRIGRWRRLTDPALLPPTDQETPCPVLASSPPASHTYDGIIFSQATQTIWLFPIVYACVNRMLFGEREFWEFNPSPDDVPNGFICRRSGFMSAMRISNGVSGSTVFLTTIKAGWRGRTQFRRCSMKRSQGRCLRVFIAPGWSSVDRWFSN
jgi:hypothetical protein